MATVAELREQYEQTVAKFWEQVEGIDPVTLETEMVTDLWSPRDVAGHVVDWQEELFYYVRHAMGGPIPSGHPLGDIESVNAMMSARRADQLWDDTSSELEISIERMRQLYDLLDQEDLERDAVMPRGRPTNVEEIMAAITRHMAEHADQLQQWREKLEV